VEAFLAAVAAQDPSLIKSGPAESLTSHRIVWAAERARQEGAVIALPPTPVIPIEENA